MGIYEKLGVKRVINAAGYYTSLGGSLMSKEVLEVMAEAAGSFVYMDELLEKAGEIIAKIIGAEGACVTSGAAAGIVLATAACITGEDLAKMKRLPNTEGLKNEVIIQKGHTVGWEQMMKMAGAKIVEVGRVGGEGTSLEEIEAAINEKTAAIAHIISHDVVQTSQVPLEKVLELARKRGIPTIVDVAGHLPPPDNLKKYIEMGADLVIFSGGKDIRGPNDSGFICGRKDLIRACAMQASPHLGVGRPMKISKEQIVGLITALQGYVEKDYQTYLSVYETKVRYIMDQLAELQHVTVSRIFPEETGLPIPRVQLILDEKALGITAHEVVLSLKNGTPPIAVRAQYADIGIILIDVMCLQENQEQIVVERLKEVLTGKKASEP